MKILSIDLSLRSTGLVYISDSEFKHKLVTPNTSYKDENLLAYIAYNIIEFIHECKPEIIAIEGLSLGSISGSKDIIAGNFWYVRTMIHKHCEFKKMIIVPVLSWRSPLFTKEERKLLTENKKTLKILQKECKDLKLTKKEMIQFNKDNKELIDSCDIKFLTYMKLPNDIKDIFSKYDGKYDLTDSYFINKHISINYK